MNITSLLLMSTFIANNASYEIIKDNVIRELIEYRSETQKVFLMNDNKYEFRFYSSPVHY